jgi:hypothetical protein
MSVDFYDCKACGTTGIYSECIASTECCGQKVCFNCVIGTPDTDEYSGDYIYDWCDMEGDAEIRKKHCPFCSGKKVSDKQLIEFLLERTGMSMKEARQVILSKRDGDNNT